MSKSEHTAIVKWERHGAVFVDNKYSRAHIWSFDGGATVPASSSPHVVKIPFSDPANVDPEEAYVAALASCHMLWFLSLAAAKGYVVEDYLDTACAHMTRREDGKDWIPKIELRPIVTFSGTRAPDDAIVEGLHHDAHSNCFLAQSVKTEIIVDGSWRYSTDR